MLLVADLVIGAVVVIGVAVTVLILGAAALRGDEADTNARRARAETNHRLDAR